jgi:Family of unknown function (DUF6062)
VTEKFVGYYRLLEALDKPGCPICRCLLEDGRRHLDALLYEQVTDVETRRRLRAAWGLCNWHTWMLATLGGGMTSAAILHEDLVRVCTRRVDALRDRRPSRLARLLRRWQAPLGPRRSAERLVRRARCPVCVAGRRGEARYLDTVVEFLGEREFAEVYARSTGLCVPHVVRAIEDGAEGDGLRRLLDDTLPKWTAVGHRLDGFIRSHEYRSTQPLSAAETSACTAAFEIVAGAAGVFGNDLHADDGAT